MNFCGKDLSIKINLLVIMILLLPVYLLSQDGQPKKIIYETDMCVDVDDAGALAILHAMANNGEAEILAVCFNEVHPYGVAAIDAMNTWYGRGDIPIGIYRGNLSNPDGSSYLQHVAKFPHDLEDADAPSALDVYRQVLAEQPDSSVTIISVGFTNNLNDLLIAEPDLVAQKVKELVQMAGGWNDDFNLSRHNLVSVSQNIIENWPTPMVISWPGGDILTGDNYENAPLENPYREAFYKWFGNNFEGRSSWDEMAVLYGVRGLSTYFSSATGGGGRLINGYTWDWEAGYRSYLQTRLFNQNYVKIIEDLMDQLPLGARFEFSSKNGWLPFLVELDASLSNVGGNRSVLEYAWSFGDGTSGTGEKVTHEYTSAGSFDIQLTVIDDLGDSLKTIEQIQVSDPIFSLVPYFGDVTNYKINQEDLWSTRIESEDLRLYVSNSPRNGETPLSGFSFVRDSIYNDFTMSIDVRSGEDLAQNSLADYSIIFGYEDDKNYNKILMKQGTSSLMNISNGQSTSIVWTTQKGIPDEQFHKVILDLSGNQLVVTLDDSVFLSATSFRLQKQGKIGFGSGKYATFFDNISIAGNAIATSIYNTAYVPGKILLEQNYPNPFNPQTTISFTLQSSENVKIEVYTTLGQIVETLVNKHMTAGHHEITFTAQGLNSGVYLYKIEAGTCWEVKKMILLK